MRTRASRGRSRPVLAGEGSAVGAPSGLEAALAEELARRMPVLESVRFTTSGSEALGFAVRVARAATGRPRVLKLEGGFHGAFGDLQQDIGNPPLPAGRAAPARPSSGGLEPTGTLTAIANDLASVEDAFARWGAEIAVVVMEPFLGNGALLDLEPAFAVGVVALARQHGALVLLDEVQGVRVDPRGAHATWGITPDLVAVGKVIGGGQPLAAYGGRADLMALAADGTVTQTGTFTASPVALAAGLAALADWGPDEQARLDALGERTRVALRTVFLDVGVPAVITGRGSMFHISLVDRPIRAYRDVVAADLGTWLQLRLALLVRGIFLMRRGTGCLSTPMTETDVDTLVAAVEDALRPG